jgi:hypothetical protein
LSHTSNPLCCGYFGDRVSLFAYAAWTVILLFYVSCCSWEGRKERWICRYKLFLSKIQSSQLVLFTLVWRPNHSCEVSSVRTGEGRAGQWGAIQLLCPSPFSFTGRVRCQCALRSRGHLLLHPTTFSYPMVKTSCLWIFFFQIRKLKMLPR